MWLREPVPENIPTRNYSGCLGVPRKVTYLPGSELVFQEPVAAISKLRGKQLWHAGGGGRHVKGLTVSGAKDLPGTHGEAHVDLAITMTRCADVSCSCTVCHAYTL